MSKKPLPKKKLIIIYIVLILIALSFTRLFIKKEIKYEIEYNDNQAILEAPFQPLGVNGTSLATMMTEFDEDLYWVAYRIIECESNWNATAQNPASSAYGLGQVIDGTFDWFQKEYNIELDRDNPDDQLYIVIKLLEDGGYNHWKASAYCWDEDHKYIKEDY